MVNDKEALVGMKINGRTLARVERNVASYEAKLVTARDRLMMAMARRDQGKVSKLSAEIARLREVRERWIVESMEMRFSELRSVMV